MCFIPLYTVSSTYSFQTITNNHHQRSLAESWAFWLFLWQVKVSPPDYPENEPPKTDVEGDPNGVILQQTQRLLAKRVKHNMTYYSIAGCRQSLSRITSNPQHNAISHLSILPLSISISSPNHAPQGPLRLLPITYSCQNIRIILQGHIVKISSADLSTVSHELYTLASMVSQWASKTRESMALSENFCLYITIYYHIYISTIMEF